MDPAPTDIYTLSLHDALPISRIRKAWRRPGMSSWPIGPTIWCAICFWYQTGLGSGQGPAIARATLCQSESIEDRKSTRLNSSHVEISYAVFCLKKKRQKENTE